MQKTILKEKYGITWYSPYELNPEIIVNMGIMGSVLLIIFRSPSF